MEKTLLRLNKMDDKTINKQIQEEFELLAKKELEITSQNGLVTLLISGNSIYQKVTINGNLSDIYKEELEEEFLNAVSLAREEVQKQIMSSLEEMFLNIAKETKKEEDDAVVIENVS